MRGGASKLGGYDRSQYRGGGARDGWRGGLSVQGTHPRCVSPRPRRGGGGGGGAEQRAD